MEETMTVAHVPMTPADRKAAGKKLRDRVPRDAHAGWQEPAGRADPVGILRTADATRQKELVPLRYGRMLQSPFTFYRGSAGVMAADLAETPATGIHVQVCGGAHLMNFGGFATPERRLLFDINDLDETLPRAHAKAGDPWTISGYLGNGGQFDDARGKFALAYADQAEEDHAALKAAVRAGIVEVQLEH